MVGHARRAAEPGATHWNAASPQGYLTRAYYVLGFHEEAAQLAPSRRQLFRRFPGTGRHDLAVAAARRLGSKLWGHSDEWMATASLAAARRPADLARLYGSKFTSPAAVCSYDPRLPIPLAWGLRNVGRASEAQELIRCLHHFIQVERRSNIRAPRRSEAELAFDSAQLAALQNNNAAAVDLLRKAILGGWRGHNHGTARLSDYPAFDSIRRDPAFAPLEQRLHRELARERAEVLSLSS